MTCVVPSAERKGDSPRFSMAPSTPARKLSREIVRGARTDQDIIGENYSVVEHGHVHEAEDTLTLSTANGPVTTNIAYVLKSSPPALSVGQDVWKKGMTLFGGKITTPCW